MDSSLSYLLTDLFTYYRKNFVQKPSSCQVLERVLGDQIMLFLSLPRQNSVFNSPESLFPALKSLHPGTFPYAPVSRSLWTNMSSRFAENVDSLWKVPAECTWLFGTLHLLSHCFQSHESAHKHEHTQCPQPLCPFEMLPSIWHHTYFPSMGL